MHLKTESSIIKIYFKANLRKESTTQNYRAFVLKIMNIRKNFSELTGNTPLYELSNIENEIKTEARILAKLECFNPAGSAKDRVAVNMIKNAEAEGKLKKGAVIIEPTSGNTGIGLAATASSKGYKVVLTMPETMSVERQNLLKAYGAEIVLTDGKKGMTGAIEKAKEIHENTPGSFLPGQFDNPSNPEAHYLTTGPEIWRDTDGTVDIFIAGIGTGGTITGTAKYLKEKNPEIKTVGFEPSGSPFLTKGTSGAHGLQGIGAGFKPEILDMSLIDEIVTVDDESAYKTAKDLARKEGILVGITSGAAVFVAEQIAKLPENKGKTIVALLPDTGERYLSTPAFM